MNDYYRIIVAQALVAFRTGDVARAGAILEAGSRGEPIPEDPQGRSLEYCQYCADWPLTELAVRD